jgi:hypothetical protein
MKRSISIISAAALLFAGVLVAAPQDETGDEDRPRTAQVEKQTEKPKSGDTGTESRKEVLELWPAPEPGDRRIPGIFPRLFEDDFEGRIEEHLNGLFKRLFEDDFKPFRFRFFDEEAMDVGKVLEEFRRKTGQLDIELGSSGTRYQFQRQDGDTTTEFALEIDGEGAVEAVMTRTDSEGDVERSTYNAPSLEEFKQKYPEVAEEFDLDGFRISFRIPDMFGSRHNGLGLRLERAPFGFERKFDRKVLGVYTQTAGAPLRAQLGLEADEGLVVSETGKGTFADKIGIKPMDVIVSVNGKKIGAADHIRAALAPVKEGDPVAVEVVRKGLRETLQGKYFIRK